MDDLKETLVPFFHEETFKNLSVHWDVGLSIVASDGVDFVTCEFGLMCSSYLPMEYQAKQIVMNNVIKLIGFMSSGLGATNTSFISKAIGKGNKKEVDHLIKAALQVLVLILALQTILVGVYQKEIISFLVNIDTIRDNLSQSFHLVIIDANFLGINNCFKGISRGMYQH